MQDFNNDVKIQAGKYHEGEFEGIYRPAFCRDPFTLEELKAGNKKIKELTSQFTQFVETLRGATKNFDGSEKIAQEVFSDASDSFQFCYENLVKRQKLFGKRLKILEHMYEYAQNFVYKEPSAFLNVDSYSIDDINNGQDPVEQFFKEVYGVNYGDNDELGFSLALFRYRCYADEYAEVVNFLPQTIHIHFQTPEDSVNLELKKITEGGQKAEAQDFVKDIDQEILEDHLDDAKNYLDTVLS